MGFRLMSFAAGAAKRGSERLKALEEDTKKLITTEAARVAEDARNINKARIKSVTEYNSAARKLKGRYQLNDGQVEAVLTGGLEGVQLFEQSLKSKALESSLAGKEFNRADAIASIVPQISPQVSARSQDEAAAAFAAAMNPYTNEGMDVAAGRIGASVGAMTRGGRAPTEYIRSQLAAQTQALGGATPKAFTGAEIGSSGYGFRPADVTVDTMIAATKAQAEARSATIAADTAQFNLDEVLPQDVEQRKAQTKALLADAGLDVMQTKRINDLLEGEIKAQEGELKLTGARVQEIASNIKKTDAVIEKMVGEGLLDKANIQLIQARIGKINIDTETAAALKDLSVKELEAKISQMNASSTLTKARTTELDARNAALPEQLAAELDETLARIGLVESQTTATIAEAGLTGTRADALRQDILLNEQFSATERQAALDLVEAKVLATGRYSDLEEFQVALLEDNRRLSETLKTAGEGPERESIRAKIRDNEARIASSAIALADVEGAEELLNKGAAPTVYNHFVRQNLQQFDVDFEYASLDQVISKIGDDQAPAAFGAFANANKEFGNVYAFNDKGGIIDAQGARFVMQKQETLNTAMGTYASRLANSTKTAEKALALGTMTEDQIAAHTGKEGEVALVTDNDGNTIGYAVFTGGRFVSAY
jgi:acylphosphatase